jgi:hypothetical protein
MLTRSLIGVFPSKRFGSVRMGGTVRRLVRRRSWPISLRDPAVTAPNSPGGEAQYEDSVVFGEAVREPTNPASLPR